jgi:hypothetical protein
MKNFAEKHFDVRTQAHYQRKGLITKKDLEDFSSKLPNDEDNFELMVFEEDDLDLGDFSEDELNSMAPITEENINNFDFLDKVSDSIKEEK